MNVKANEDKAQGSEWGQVCAKTGTWMKDIDSEESP